MTVLTLLSVLLVGQPDRPGDLSTILDLPGVLPPPVAPDGRPPDLPSVETLPSGDSVKGTA